MARGGGLNKGKRGKVKGEVGQKGENGSGAVHPYKVSKLAHIDVSISTINYLIRLSSEIPYYALTGMVTQHSLITFHY